MAAAFGSFSIREYALTMRTLDVAKSWPFGGQSDEVKKEAAEGFLPPIAVTKFRWWSNEFEPLKSNCDKPDLEMKIDGNKISSERVEAENSNASEEEKEKLEKVCPVCRVFAASTVNAVNAHIDGCLALASTEEQWQMKKASHKTKSRVPKKRSIAEIFSVVPPIEAIPSPKYEHDEHIDGNGPKQGEITKSKAPKSKDSVSAIETITDMKKTKKKMRKGWILVETSTPIANRSNKHKKNFNNGEMGNIITAKETGGWVQLHNHYCKTQQHHSSNRRQMRGVFNHVSVRRKEIASKGSLTQREHKLVLDSRKKMSTPPCIRILKNKAMATHELSSTNRSLQASDQATLRCKGRSERHLRFLDKEVLLGSESFTGSKEKEKTIEGDEEVSRFEARESGDVDADVQCMTGKRQLSDAWDRNKSPSTAKFVIQDQNCPTFSSGNASFGTPGSVDLIEEQHKIRVETQVCSNVSTAFDSYQQLIDHLVDPQHPVEKSLVTSSSFSIPLPSSAFNENADKRFSAATPSVAKPYASPVVMVGSRGPFPGYLQSELACKRNRIVNEFFGLPLNSQGELIHLSSSGTNGFIHPEESRSVAASSSNVPSHNSFLSRNLSECRTANERDLPKYHINLFPSPNYVEGTRRAETQWVNFEKRVNQPVNSLPLSDFSWMNISIDRCRYLGKVQGQKEYHEYPTQQTMRLMGKDVAVGRSSKPIQGLECGKFWRNCENMTDYLPAYTNTNQFNPCSNRVFFPEHSGQAQSETPKDTLVHPSRFQNNQTLQGKLWTPQASSDPFLINETNAPYQNCKAPCRDGNAADGLFKENPRLNVHLIPHSTSCSPILNVTPNIQQRYVSGVEPLMFGVQPVMSSQNSSQDMYSSGGLSCKPNFIQSKSGIGFPLLHQVHADHKQSPNFQVSKNLPAWMFQSKELEKTPFSRSRTCSGMNWNSYSHISPGNKILNTPSTSHFPRVPYPCKPTTPSNSYMNTALASTSVFHQHFVPIIPGTKPIAALNTLNIKDSVSSKKINKRPADELVYPRKTPKTTISKMQDFVAGLTRGKSESQQQKWIELHSSQDVAADTFQCCEMEALIDGPSVDSMARVGSGGTKHILKPSERMEHDNSKPIHSTIPFSAISSNASLPESQKKTAKVYSL